MGPETKKFLAGVAALAFNAVALVGVFLVTLAVAEIYDTAIGLIGTAFLISGLVGGQQCLGYVREHGGTGDLAFRAGFVGASFIAAFALFSWAGSQF